jgi:hypothetical protein
MAPPPATPPHPGSLRKWGGLRQNADIAAGHIGAYLSLYRPLSGHRLKSAAKALILSPKGHISK